MKSSGRSTASKDRPPQRHQLAFGDDRVRIHHSSRSPVPANYAVANLLLTHGHKLRDAIGDESQESRALDHHDARHSPARSRRDVETFPQIDHRELPPQRRRESAHIRIRNIYSHQITRWKNPADAAGIDREFLTADA